MMEKMKAISHNRGFDIEFIVEIKIDLRYFDTVQLAQ